MTNYNYNNPDYMPLRSLVVQPDATYVAPYRQQVLVPKEKPKAELTAIPANKRPLSWQVQTAGENYDAVHNKVKDAWDKYLISPEDVKDANDYYENELMYEDFPGAIPLAALGSTLSGEAYDAWRDLQTDPANLIGGELLRGGKKIFDKSVGAIKLTKKELEAMNAAHRYDDGKTLVYHGSPTKGIKKFDPAYSGSYGGDVSGLKGLYAGDIHMANRYATGDIASIGARPITEPGSIYTLRIPTDKILPYDINQELAWAYQNIVKQNFDYGNPSMSFLNSIGPYIDQTALAQNNTATGMYNLIKDAAYKLLRSGNIHAVRDYNDQFGEAVMILPEHMHKYKPLFETEGIKLKN